MTASTRNAVAGQPVATARGPQKLVLRRLAAPATGNGAQLPLGLESDDLDGATYGASQVTLQRLAPAGPIRAVRLGAGFAPGHFRALEGAEDPHDDGREYNARAAAAQQHPATIPLTLTHALGMAGPARRYAPYADAEEPPLPLPSQRMQAFAQRPVTLLATGIRDRDLDRGDIDPAVHPQLDQADLDDLQRQQQQRVMLLQLLQEAVRNGSLGGGAEGAAGGCGGGNGGDLLGSLGLLLANGGGGGGGNAPVLPRAAPRQPDRSGNPIGGPAGYTPPRDQDIGGDGDGGGGGQDRPSFAAGAYMGRGSGRPGSYSPHLRPLGRAAMGNAGLPFGHPAGPGDDLLAPPPPPRAGIVLAAEGAAEYGEDDAAAERLRLLAALAANASDPRITATAAAAGQLGRTREAVVWEDGPVQHVLPNGRPVAPGWRAAAWAAPAATGAGARGGVQMPWPAPSEEQLRPRLPLTVLHTDRKCPKVLAPRSGRVGDVKHVVLPAEIAQALPTTLLDGEEPVHIRAVLCAPFAPNGASHWQCNITCHVGNGPGGFPALHVPVPEQLYGRPVRRFTLCEDMVMELELGEVTVQPRAVETPASGGGDEAAGTSGQTFEGSDMKGYAPSARHSDADGSLLKKQDARAAAANAGAAAMTAMLAAAAARLQAGWRPPAAPQFASPMAAAAAAAAAGSSSCRSAHAPDATADLSEPAAAQRAEAYSSDGGERGLGGSGGGPAPELPIIVRRPRGPKPTVMRACTGAVGSKKHLPLPAEILRAMPAAQRSGIESVAVVAVYFPDETGAPEEGAEEEGNGEQATRGRIPVAVEKQLCSVGPSGSHGCMALQVPITERMNNRRLLYITLHTNYSIELGMGEVVRSASASGGRRRGGGRGGAAAAGADDEETETDDEMRVAAPRRRPREELSAPRRSSGGSDVRGAAAGLMPAGAGPAPLSAAAMAAAAAALAGCDASGAAAGVDLDSAPPLKRRRSSSSGPQASAAAAAAANGRGAAAAGTPAAELDFGTSSARGSCDGNKDRSDGGTAAVAGAPAPERLGPGAGPCDGMPPAAGVHVAPARNSNTQLPGPLSAGPQPGLPPVAAAMAPPPYLGAAADGIKFESPADAPPPPPQPVLRQLEPAASGGSGGGYAGGAAAAQRGAAGDPTAAAAATLGRVWGLLQQIPRVQLAAAKALSAARQRRMAEAAPDDRDAAAAESLAVLIDLRSSLGNILYLLLQARAAAAADASKQQAVVDAGGSVEDAAAAGDPRVSRCLLSSASLMLHAAECVIEWYNLLLSAATEEDEAAAAAVAAELGGSAALVRAQLTEALAGLPPPPPSPSQAQM